VFDVLAGLPVHVLVVHAAVVGLPVMAVITILVTARSSWRGALAWVVALDALNVVVAFVAKESGEKLQSRLSATAGHLVAEDHGEAGNLIPLLAFGLLAAAGLAWLILRRRPALTPLAIALVSAAGVAVVVWTVIVGHSGAEAVWKDTVAATSPGPSR
jgi:hypothetical protein